MPSPRPGLRSRSRSPTPAPHPQCQFPRYDQMMSWKIQQCLEEDPAVVKVLAILRSSELVAGKLFTMCVRTIPCESLSAAYNTLASELGRRKRNKIYVRAIPLPRINETRRNSNKETKRSLERHSRSKSRSRKYSSRERHRRQRSLSPDSRNTSKGERRQISSSDSVKRDAKKSVILESCSNPVLPVVNKELEPKTRQSSKSKSPIPNQNFKNSLPCRPLETNYDKVSSLPASTKIRKSRSQTRKSKVRRSRHSRSRSSSSSDHHQMKMQKICSRSEELSRRNHSHASRSRERSPKIISQPSIEIPSILPSISKIQAAGKYSSALQNAYRSLEFDESCLITGLREWYIKRLSLGLPEARADDTYNAEWEKYWNIRYKEILAEGKGDPDNQKIAAEFRKVWPEKVEKMLNEKLDKSLKKIRSKHGFDEESIQRLLGSGQTIKSEPDPEEEGIPLMLPFRNFITGGHKNHLPLSLSQGSKFSSSSLEQIIKLETPDRASTSSNLATAPKPWKTVERHNLPAKALSEDTETSDSIRGGTTMSNQAVPSTASLVQDTLRYLISFGERMSTFLQQQIKEYYAKSFGKGLSLSDKKFQDFLDKCQKQLENMAKLPLIPPKALERVEESLVQIARLLQLSQAHSHADSSEEDDNDSGTSGLSNISSSSNDCTRTPSSLKPSPPLRIKVEAEVQHKEVTNQIPAPHPPTQVQTAGLGAAFANNLIPQEHGLVIGEREQINSQVGISSCKNRPYVDPFARFRRPRRRNSGADFSRNKQSHP